MVRGARLMQDFSPGLGHWYLDGGVILVLLKFWLPRTPSLPHTLYTTVFNRLRRVPPATMERAILQAANSPCTGPARKHCVCVKHGFCVKQFFVAKTVLTQKHWFCSNHSSDFNHSMCVNQQGFGKGQIEKGFGKGHI